MPASECKNLLWPLAMACAILWLSSCSRVNQQGNSEDATIDSENRSLLFSETEIAPECFRHFEHEADTEIGGCGDFLVFKRLDSTTFLTVHVNRELLQVTSNCTTFYIEDFRESELLSVSLHSRNSKNQIFSFCNDMVPGEEQKPDRLNASKGRIIVALSQANVKGRYKAFVEVKNLEYTDNRSKKSIAIASELFYGVTVGWYAG